MSVPTGRRTLILAAVFVTLGVDAQAAYLDREIESEGVALHVRVEALAEYPAPQPKAGEVVRLRVEARRLADDQPLSGLPLGAWLDRETSVTSGAVPVCAQRVSGFLGGNLLQRPLVDLTGYYVLTLDAEGSVSVLDPAVQFASRSSLYTAVQLGGRGFDWVKSADDGALFVAVPERREVVSVDLQVFTVSKRIELPGEPTRLALQPDGRLLWAAYRGQTAEAEGIAVIDVQNGEVLGRIALQSGHHEIAFSDDSRFAYVSSRDAGAVIAIDTASLAVAHTLEFSGQPMALIYLQSQQQLWVIDGQQGVVHRVSRDGAHIDRLGLQRGIGPARLTPDGRHVLVLNTSDHRLSVLDSATGALKQTITISGRPYDLQFTEQYAYVRALDTEKVVLLALGSLDRDPVAVARAVAAGSEPGGAFPQLPIASGMTPTLHNSGAFIATPAERMVYHYMEGMNAPDSGIKAYGHTPLAVLVARRGLREVGRGIYATTFKLPSAGRLVLALAAESTRLRECIGLAVATNVDSPTSSAWRVEWADDGLAVVEAGHLVELTAHVRAGTGSPRPVELDAWLVPGAGGKPLRWRVQPGTADGEYRVSGRVDTPGGYYVHLRPARRADSDASTLPATLLVMPARKAEGASR